MAELLLSIAGMESRTSRLSILILLASLLAAAPSTSAAPSDPSPQAGPKEAKYSADLQARLAGLAPDAPVAVIVQTYTAPGADQFNRLRAMGGEARAASTTIRAYSARVPAARIAVLADDPDVERISYDAPVKAHLDVAYRAVRADLVFSYSNGIITGLEGRGAAIALIDTGVQAHADIKRPKGYPQPIEVEIVGRESGMADYYGHGTHVAGILNGSGYASSDSLSFRTFRGLAPGAQLISVRALQPDGTGYTSDIIRGIDWVVQNRQTYKIRVLNLSLGHPVYESYKDDPLCRAAAQAVNQGIVVVAAAGNDGTVGTGFGTITSPANAPSVITVGAMQDFNTVTTGDDVPAWYSAKGPTLVDFVAKPDLVAPGTWIVSARATGSYIDKAHHDMVLKVGEYRNDSRYAAYDGVYLTMAGTSMAAPMVAATAALMIQKEPGLNPATVKARLMRSAVKDDRLIFETGAGYLDVYAAVNATGYADMPFSPLLLAAEDGGVYLQDTTRIWGADWPLGSIWGDGKGRASGIVLSDVPASITEAHGYIWGGKAASVSLVDNSQVTASGAIWTGRASSLPGTTGLVTNDGSIWGHK